MLPNHHYERIAVAEADLAAHNDKLIVCAQKVHFFLCAKEAAGQTSAKQLQLYNNAVSWLSDLKAVFDDIVAS
ncbi:hypothetical protein N7478_012768 [Penicillium angulare]|uniref:uncharacterized protein n=1 Tax=Penicillium angulare TaxID=116970 RepID=UPI0025404F97|nr:uncharacterized protein N7478_012768 [Penicillium angulare]KAJ5256664.1 hypothetical protein N7478_012768 [Penicillium angulare]